MNKEQLDNIKNRIESQKKNLEHSELVYSIYEKINFITEKFPKNCLIHLLLMYSREERKYGIASLSSWIGTTQIFIDSDELRKNNINPYFPKEANNDEEKYTLKNTEEGINKFIKSLLGDSYEMFHYLALSEKLDVNNKEIKKPKI
jgi:hypothetical protein